MGDDGDVAQVHRRGARFLGKVGALLHQAPALGYGPGHLAEEDPVLHRTEQRRRLSPWVELLEVEVGPDDDRQLYHGLAIADYATALAVRPDGRFLLIRQYRPVADAMMWELPSGMVDAGEAPAEAACRETFEETGYRVRAHHPLGAVLVDGGRLANRAHAILALVDAAPEAPAEPGIDVYALVWQETCRRLVHGGLAHANHVAVIAQVLTDPDAAAFLARHGVPLPWAG